MKLLQFQNLIIPKFFLTIVFFLFLLPLSLLSKIFNKDTLMLSKKNKTYFIEINKEMDVQYFEKSW